MSGAPAEKLAASANSDSEPTPLIIVEGFLGSTGSVLWGKFEEHLNDENTRRGLRPRKGVFARVGPVSSLHDRACELYYATVGGTVDYGKEHSRHHGHKRYGRQREGIYPLWSKNRPLHFLGHSMGGPTIIKLQYLLSQGFFGTGGHPDMMLSVTTISAPFRGTQIVYILGEREDAAPAVRPMSIGSVFAKGVHLISYLAPFLPRALDLHTEARGLSCQELPVAEFLKQLWKSDWAESRDATPYDVTYESVDEREATDEGKAHPRTFYRSHVASMTSPIEGAMPFHAPSLSQLSTPLYLPARAIGSFDFSVLRPAPSFVPPPGRDPDDLEQGSPSIPSDEEHLGEEHWENDGVVPVFSQWHPHACSRTACIHHSRFRDNPSNQIDSKPELRPGIWDVHHLEDTSHASVVPFWLGSQRQKQFWTDLGIWLTNIDERT